MSVRVPAPTNIPPPTATHDWEKLVSAVQSHIGSLNWGYRVQLREKSVTYLNAYAQFVDEHTLKVSHTFTTRRAALLASGKYDASRRLSVRQPFSVIWFEFLNVVKAV